MKSGDIYEQSEVIRDLVGMSKVKVLGSSDKMMLDTAQQLLISEIELVKDVDTEQATVMLKHAVCPEEMSEIVP